MTTYAFPSITPSETTIGRKANTRAFTSPFNGVVQTEERGGSRLFLRMVFRNRSDAERQELIGFLMKLNGMEHRFSARDYSHTQRGVLTGTPLVKGGGQTGSSLLIDGCTPNVTNWIRAGDQFQIGSELKIVTADANSNASGEVTINFRSALRFAVVDNQPISTTAPSAIWMLTSDSIDWATGDGPTFSDFVIEAIEDLTA